MHGSGLLPAIHTKSDPRSIPCFNQAGSVSNFRGRRSYHEAGTSSRNYLIFILLYIHTYTYMLHVDL